nr:hypothetical protein CFP56_31530 [Quercus suber]
MIRRLRPCSSQREQRDLMRRSKADTEVLDSWSHEWQTSSIRTWMLSRIRVLNSLRALVHAIFVSNFTARLEELCRSLTKIPPLCAARCKSIDDHFATPLSRSDTNAERIAWLSNWSFKKWSSETDVTTVTFVQSEEPCEIH